MLSAPQMLQAHLILLASRGVGIHTPPADDKKSNTVMMNHTMSSFELSVELYVSYLSTLGLFDSSTGDQDPSRCFHIKLLFGSCLRPLTYDKLNKQIDKLISFCFTHSRDVLSETRAQIFETSVNYVNANKHVLDEMCMDDACLILNSIISSVLPTVTEQNVSNRDGEGIQQEMFCLAAVLKLMGSSLLQILWHLKQDRFLIGMKFLKDQFMCKEYEFISGIISCFEKYGVSKPIQSVLSQVKGTDHRFEQLKLMLAHFSSLLEYSLRTRIGFLWRDCIFMMMATMNLLYFEEGNLDAFYPLLRNEKEDTFPQYTPAKTPKGSVHRSSSVVMASNIRNIQMVYDTQDGNMLRIQDGQSGGVDYCSAENYLACLPEYRKNPSEFDDLKDFIECKSGKDYSDWFKKRHKFKKWQHRKRLSWRCKHKKKMVMKGALKNTHL